ncbi:site-specific DNA-methyltransferase [Candidatus Lokiarchaeum ossiferum]|uniref:site-specific DNA-methyltransferase n=1 Tax=Candidatus Lokiarchaeum ossiferum TaxID=2951803 RepID=UPI00352C9D6A
METNKEIQLLSIILSIFQQSDAHLNFGIHKILGKFRSSLKKNLLKTIDLSLIQNSIEFSSKEKELFWDLLIEFFSLYFPKGKLYNIPKNLNNSIATDFFFQWVNEDQYYYKIDDFYFNYQTILGDFQVSFITSKVELEDGGKNKPKRYFIPALINSPITYSPENRSFSINFEYRSLNEAEKELYSRNYQAKINKFLFRSFQENFGSQILTTEDLDKLFACLEEFTSQRYSDRFIHPHLLNYLHDQAKSFIIANVPFPIVTNCENGDSFRYNILYQGFILSSNIIIEQICSLETLKKKLYEKKKFITKTDLIVPLKSIPTGYYPEILNNKMQQRDWLNLVGYSLSSIDSDNFLKSGVINNSIPSNIQNLPVNTGLYSGKLRYSLLNALNKKASNSHNLLIKGENWQVLNLLKSKFFQKIKTIYIDPPYNTGANDFVYSDNFQKASWLTMMQNRLELSKYLLKSDGILFSSIGDHELPNYSLLLEKLFPKRLDNIVWHKKTQPSYLSQELISVTEYILAAKKQNSPLKLMGSYGNKNKLTELINIGNSPCKRIFPKENIFIANGWTGILQAGTYGKNKLKVELLNPQISVNEGIPDEDLILKSRFKWVQDRINHELDIGGQIHIKSIKSLRPTIARFYDSPIIKAPTTLLSKKVNDLPTNTDANAELKALFQTSPFDYSKPSKLIKYLVRSSTYFDKSGIILDFFAGSGTTAQSVIELNQEDQGSRQYILIEKEQYFESIIIPRIQKLMYSSTWKDGKPESLTGCPHIAKIFQIEHFCDTFRNIIFSNEIHPEYKTPQSGKKFLKYVINMDDITSSLNLNITEFEDPFSYYMISSQNGIMSEVNLDLVETFNFLLGIDVNSHEYFEEQNRAYQIVSGTILPLNSSQKHNLELILIIWRTTKDLDRKKESHFLTKNYLTQQKFAQIYFNGVSTIPNGKVLDKLFLKLMFEDL